MLHQARCIQEHVLLMPSLPMLQKYTNHDLVKYLESIGAEFGACQNAYTSADDTVYEFLVPTDDAHTLENSFDVFAEFATKIRYSMPAVQTKLIQSHDFHCSSCRGTVFPCIRPLISW